jgi:hypothetical protein
LYFFLKLFVHAVFQAKMVPMPIIGGSGLRHNRLFAANYSLFVANRLLLG